MRLIIARRSVDYADRLSTHLPLATRLIMIKADGSLVIHSDSGTKALNWMSAGGRFTELVQDSDSDGGPCNSAQPALTC